MKKRTLAGATPAAGQNNQRAQERVGEGKGRAESENVDNVAKKSACVRQRTTLWGLELDAVNAARLHEGDRDEELLVAVTFNGSTLTRLEDVVQSLKEREEGAAAAAASDGES